MITLGKWVVFACLLLTGFATSGLASEPRVILYTVAGCRPCRLALESLRELGIEPTVTRDCPSWVTQTPTIHWRDRAGVWRQHAPQHWSGPTWSDAETAKLRRWLLPSSATKSTRTDPYLTVSALADKFDVESAEKSLQILCDAEGVNLDALAKAAGVHFSHDLKPFNVTPVNLDSAPFLAHGVWMFSDDDMLNIVRCSDF